jgi:hypothetical protein
LRLVWQDAGVKFLLDDQYRSLFMLQNPFLGQACAATTLPGISARMS